MSKKLLPLLVLAAAAAVVAVLLRTRPVVETAPREIAPPPVRVVAVQPTSVELRVRSQGSVVPVTEADLVSEVAGSIVWTAESFEVGGFFDAGDVLLRLDRRDYELALASARASVAQARVALTREEAEAEVAREEWEDLGEPGEPGPLVLREPQLEEARARVEAAEASEARAELDLSRTTIRAPFAGRLRAKRVDRGEFVNRGVPLATIYSVDAAEVTLPVPDSELAFLELPLGSELGGAGPRVILQAEFAGGRHEWAARVVRVGGGIDPATRMVNLIARVQDPYRAASGRPPLSVGLFVDAEILGRSFDSVFKVPRGALVGADQLWLVEDGRLMQRRVGILRSDPDVAIVADGLASGDLVSLTILETAVDGMSVTLEVVAPEVVSPEAAVPEPVAAESVVAEPAAPAERPAAAAGERATLMAIELEYGAGFVDVLLRTGREPAYRTFWLDDPPRYVVDLADCVMRASSTRVAVDQDDGGGGTGASPARSVRAAQFRGGSDPITRVVIDGAVRDEVEPIGDAAGLRLRLREGAR